MNDSNSTSASIPSAELCFLCGVFSWIFCIVGWFIALIGVYLGHSAKLQGVSKQKEVFLKVGLIICYLNLTLTPVLIVILGISIVIPAINQPRDPTPPKSGSDSTVITPESLNPKKPKLKPSVKNPKGGLTPEEISQLETDSMNNLYSIYSAIKMYAKRYEGFLPPHVEAMIDEGFIIDKAITQSPFNPRSTSGYEMLSTGNFWHMKDSEVLAQDRFVSPNGKRAVLLRSGKVVMR